MWSSVEFWASIRIGLMVIFIFVFALVLLHSTYLFKRLDKAEHVNRMNRLFLAALSHEIRTPDLSLDQRDTVSTLIISSDTLMRLINDLLLFSRMEAGRFELSPDWFDSAAFFKHCNHTFEMRAQAKEIAYTCHGHEALPKYLYADHGRLRQILNNLIDNAIKFVEPTIGDIRVEITVHRDLPQKTKIATPRASFFSLFTRKGSSPRPSLGSVSAAAASSSGFSSSSSSDLSVVVPSPPPSVDSDVIYLDVSVTDNGIGIDPSNHERIFQVFSQADAATSKLKGGSGLGLNISRSLARQMGGDLKVESQLDKGTTFRFQIQCHGCNQIDQGAITPTAELQTHPDAPFFAPDAETAANSFLQGRSSASAATAGASSAASSADSGAGGSARSASASAVPKVMSTDGRTVKQQQVVTDFDSVYQSPFYAARDVTLSEPHHNRVLTQALLRIRPAAIVAGALSESSAASGTDLANANPVLSPEEYSSAPDSSSSSTALPSTSPTDSASYPSSGTGTILQSTGTGVGSGRGSGSGSPQLSRTGGTGSANQSPFASSRSLLGDRDRTRLQLLQQATATAAAVNAGVSPSPVLPVRSLTLSSSSSSSSFSSSSSSSSPALTPSSEFGSFSSTNSAPSSREGTPQVSLRVLVAEDDGICQRVAKKLVEKCGHTVSFANNGLEAIQLFRENAGQYDMILMDVNMPVMDGIEATSKIRDIERSRAAAAVVAAAAAAAATSASSAATMTMEPSSASISATEYGELTSASDSTDPDRSPELSETSASPASSSFSAAVASASGTGLRRRTTHGHSSRAQFHARTRSASSGSALQPLGAPASSASSSASSVSIAATPLPVAGTGVTRPISIVTRSSAGQELVSPPSPSSPSSQASGSRSSSSSSSSSSSPVRTPSGSSSVSFSGSSRARLPLGSSPPSTSVFGPLSPISSPRPQLRTPSPSPSPSPSAPLSVSGPERIPIISVTADSSDELALHCQRSGFDAVITKPIKPKVLKEKLDEIVQKVLDRRMRTLMEQQHGNS